MRKEKEEGKTTRQPGYEDVHYPASTELLQFKEVISLLFLFFILATAAGIPLREKFSVQEMPGTVVYHVNKPRQDALSVGIRSYHKKLLYSRKGLMPPGY
jgi:hypothetical protein